MSLNDNDFFYVNHYCYNNHARIKKYDQVEMTKKLISISGKFKYFYNI